MSTVTVDVAGMVADGAAVAGAGEAGVVPAGLQLTHSLVLVSIHLHLSLD